MTAWNLNINFEYRYRDYGNFKNYNSVVFGNEKNLTVEEIDRIISQVLGYDPTFEAAGQVVRSSPSKTHHQPFVAVPRSSQFHRDERVLGADPDRRGPLDPLQAL